MGSEGGRWIPRYGASPQSLLGSGLQDIGVPSSLVTTKNDGLMILSRD